MSIEAKALLRRRADIEARWRKQLETMGARRVSIRLESEVVRMKDATVHFVGTGSNMGRVSPTRRFVETWLAEQAAETDLRLSGHIRAVGFAVAFSLISCLLLFVVAWIASEDPIHLGAQEGRYATGERPVPRGLEG